jgi:pyridoxine 5'-phosphate synthase PdxJ
MPVPRALAKASLAARAVFVGLESATNEMKNLMLEARV